MNNDPKKANRMKLCYNTDVNVIGSIPDYHMIIKALPYIYKKDNYAEESIVRDNEFNFRTEKSRKRFLSALNSAFVNENQEVNDFIGNLLVEKKLDENSKKIVLFWTLNLNNQLFREINQNVFLRKYYQGRAELPMIEVEAYLRDLISTTDELKGRWSNTTINTIASKYLTILKKLDLLGGRKKKLFSFISVSDELIACLIHLHSLLNLQGANFMEHEFSQWMFIPKDSILERLKKISKRDWIEMNYAGKTLKVGSKFETKNIIDGIFR